MNNNFRENENRIVRIRNKRIHHLISGISKVHDVPYQHVFEEFCDYIAEGNVLGDYSNLVIAKRIQDKMNRGDS